jgi:hypothetical protein
MRLPGSAERGLGKENYGHFVSGCSICRLNGGKNPCFRGHISAGKYDLEEKISLNISRLEVKPACMAGVRTSRPNFSALCGLTKL